MRTWSKTPKNAKTDIECFKVFLIKNAIERGRNYLCAPFSNRQYKLFERTELEELKTTFKLNKSSINGIYLVDSGYYSFPSFSDALELCNYLNDRGMLATTIKCTIPKDATYMRGAALLTYNRTKTVRYKSLVSSEIFLATNVYFESDAAIEKCK